MNRVIAVLCTTKLSLADVYSPSNKLLVLEYTILYILYDNPYMFHICICAILFVKVLLAYLVMQEEI